MPTRLEDLLATAGETDRGEPQVARAVFRRLQFFSRVMRSAAAAEGARVRLVWFEESGAVRSVNVGPKPIVIGRDPGCEVILSGPRVSRRHSVVRLNGDDGRDITIEDLGSSNGTTVNGVLLCAGERELQDGAVIEIGGVALAVVAGGAAG